MNRTCLVVALASWTLSNATAWAGNGECGDNCAAGITIRNLLCMSCEELEATYRGGTAPQALSGKFRGTVIVAPGSRANLTMSHASRLMWQGKVFAPNCGLAVNRFFGVRVVKGQVAPGESWMDGGPALILDYRQTSHIYANVRDEIRQIAPGLYLGAMYEESCECARFKMYFVLESTCCK
jgi:hypothetical protein